MVLLAKNRPQPLKTLSRTSSFSAATSSSTSSSKCDNPIMVTSRNLQCMPSDDEDELEEDDDDDDEDNDDDLLLSEAINHPFFSVETDFPKNCKRKSDGAISNNKATTTGEYGQEENQQRKEKAQRHSIGLPIQTPHQQTSMARHSQHLPTSMSYPNNQNNDMRHIKPTMMMQAPLLSIEATQPPLATTVASASIPSTHTFHHPPLTPPPPSSNASSSQYLRHRASLSGVDLIMAREQFEQQKQKNKNHPLHQKKWDSSHAPIGGLLARLPQQGQHTISFQQQQLQQMQLQRQQQQQQQQMLLYQQQQQQMYQQYYYYHPAQRTLNGLPRW